MTISREQSKGLSEDESAKRIVTFAPIAYITTLFGKDLLSEGTDADT